MYRKENVHWVSITSLHELLGFVLFLSKQHRNILKFCHLVIYLQKYILTFKIFVNLDIVTKLTRNEIKGSN